MKKLPPKPCWICGDPSNSREHKIKKSDFVRRYGNQPFHKISGMLHFTDGVSRNVQGPSSKILSYEPIICSNCNDNKSQPWDRAYEQFEKWLFENSRSIFQRRFILLEDVFGSDNLSSACPSLYKYFVKAFGCRLASADFTVPAELVKLLDQEYFLTKLRLSFSINKSTFALLPEDRDNNLGIGELFRVDSRSKGVMERYTWYLDIGWLRVWFFYDLEVPCGLGVPWTSDCGCLYLGEFETASLDELIECARKENAPALSHLEEIRSRGGITIE